MENKEITIQDVINKRKEHSRRVDTKLIMKAYNLANEKHKDQKRSSGEPYIIHPLNVAYILADIGLDESTISAALLHDVVEDTDVTDDFLRKEFGKYGNCHYEEILEYKGQEKLDEINRGIKEGKYILVQKANGMHIVGKLRRVDSDVSKFYSILKHLSADGYKDLQALSFRN